MKIGSKGFSFSIFPCCFFLGLPTLSAPTTVSIHVAAVNRNSPQFDPRQDFSSEISEAIEVGAIVARVTASDADRGQYTF